MSRSVEIRVQLSKTESQFWGLEFSRNHQNQIQVSKINDLTPANFANICVGDVLLFVNERNASRMDLVETANYFKTINVADLVFSRIQTAPPPSLIRQTSNRQVIELLDDDDLPSTIMNAHSVLPTTHSHHLTGSMVPSRISSIPSQPIQRPAITHHQVSRPPAPPVQRPAPSGGRFGQSHQVIDLMSTDDEDKSDDESHSNSDDDDSIFGRLTGRSMPAANTPHNAPSNQVLQTLSVGVSSSSSSNGIAMTNSRIASLKRALPAVSTPQSSSAVKRIKVGNVEIKLEHEPLLFGQANVGDEVVEIRDPDGGEEESSVGPSTGGSAVKSVPVYGDDDLDIEFVGGNMNTAADMPHQREACTKHVFGSLLKNPQDMIHNIEFCPNCYCFVCDIKTSDCCDWREHCHATHKDNKWRLEKAARNSRIMSLMSPVNRAAFFSANKTYLSSNHKAALGIRRFYGGGGLDVMSTMMANQNYSGASDDDSSYVNSYMQGMGGSGNAKSGISLADQQTATAMMTSIQSKLEQSGVQSGPVSLIGGSSSSSGRSTVEQTQMFLEASALLLKLMSMPSFPAWEVEPLPALFTAWVLHPRCTKELRLIYKEEIRTLAMSRTLSMGFRSLIRLLDVADLDFTWMKVAANKSYAGVVSARDCVLPQDIMALCVEPIVSLLLGELSAQNKFAEMRNILAAKPDYMLKLKAAVCLIERGGLQRNEMAVDLLSLIDQPDFWGTTLHSGEGKTQFNRLTPERLLQFLASFIDTHLSATAGMRIIRSEGLFEALFHFTLSKLFGSFRVVEVAEVLKCVSFFVDIDQQPPSSASAWLESATNKKPVPILSPLETSAQALVLFALYVRRRISAASRVTTLAHCKDLIHTHVEKSISGSCTILCVTAANAMLYCWKFSSPTSTLVNSIDMNLFVAGEIAKKIFGGVNYDVQLHQALDVRIREEWRRLPTVHCVDNREGSLRSTMNTCGLNDVSIPSPTSGLRAFRFDTHRTDAVGPKEVLVNAAYASDVLRCALYPADPAANITAYQVFGNSLKYGSIFYIVRNLVKQSALAVSQKVNFACFVFQHLECLQIAWKGFLVNCLIYLFDASPDAHTKYTMFYDFLQQVRKMLNCFFDPACSFDLTLVVGWYAEISRTKTAETSGFQSASVAMTSTNDQCYLMCINLYVIGALNTVCSSYEPAAKQTILSDLKRFFLKLSTSDGDTAVLAVHHQYLLGHMNVTRREVWSEFWCPFLRKIRFKIATTESAAIVNVILEDWDAVRQALGDASHNVQHTESLLGKLGLLSEEDFRLVALSGEGSAKQLVDIVEMACRDKAHGIAHMNLISLIILSNTTPRVSALDAIARRFSADSVRVAAMAFIPFFALVVRGWSAPSETVSSDKVQCYRDTLAAYEIASTTVQSDLILAENMSLSCAYLGQFQLVTALFNSSGLMNKIVVQQGQFGPDRTRILRDALMRCESQAELETALTLFDSYFSSCYLDLATVNTMQPLVDKYEHRFPEPGPAFKLLMFYHQYNEQTFEAYWAAVEHSAQVDVTLVAFMQRVAASPRLHTRNHFLILFRFFDEKDYADYLSELNVRTHAFDREQAVLVLLETAQKCSEVLRSALFLVVARFLINMPSLTAQVRQVLTVGLDRASVRQLIESVESSPYQFTRVHTLPGHADDVADEADSIPLNVALNLLLFINDPAQAEALHALKGFAGFNGLKARVFVLLRDFAHPGPTISLLLQDREYNQLIDFLVELTVYERDGECTLICAAIEQLTASITPQSIVPHDEKPHSPGRASQPSPEQCHREFFQPCGLVRILGRFLAIVTERANLKDLSTVFSEAAQRIERCVAVLIKRIFDLTSFDMLLFYYLKLCSDFSAGNITSFIEQCNHFGYLGAVPGAPPLERSASGSSAFGNGVGIVHYSSFGTSSATVPPLSVTAPADTHPPLSSLSTMLDAELQDDDAMFIDELKSFADEAHEEDRALIVDATLDMLLALKSNFVSDLRKLDELFNVVSTRPTFSVASLRDPVRFAALVHRLFSKPTQYLSESQNEAPLIIQVPKGLLWVPPKDAPNSNAAVYSSLLSLVSKYQLRAADAILLPLMQRLDNPSCTNSQVTSVSPSRQLKNEGVRRLIKGVHGLNLDCRNSWTALYSIMALHDQYSFDQLQLALIKVVNSPVLSCWISIVSAIVTNHIIRSYSIRNGNIMSITEVFRVIFFEFPCPAIDGQLATRRNLFGLQRSNELVDDLVTNHSIDAQRELAASMTRTVYTVMDISRYPQLLKEVTTARGSPLFECQVFRGLWEALMRTPAKVDFGVLLQSTFLKVAGYIATERMAARIKTAFEEFLLTFRRCFQYYGPGANVLIQAAKNSAKTLIRSKPAAVKMLMMLDEAVPE